MAESEVIYNYSTACLLLGAGILFYKYLTRKYNKHKKAGIPGPKAWPLIGCTREIMKMGVLNYDTSMVEQYGKVVGIYLGSTPALIISDLDILQEILVKHFDHFCNRSKRGISQYPLRKMISLLEFDHWKHVRKSLSPTFSGGKLRRMNPAINQSCRTFVTRLLNKCENDEVVELNEVIGKYAMAVIASTTYGLDIKSEDENDEFVGMANKLMNHAVSSKMGLFKSFIIAFFPWVVKWFNFSLLPKDSTDFFLDVFNQILKQRNGETQFTYKLTPKPDRTFMDIMNMLAFMRTDGRGPAGRRNFLEMITELHIDDPNESDLEQNEDLVKSNQGYIYSKKGLTHEEILAQSIIFFMAGFSTTTTTLSFLFYNLACCSDVQEKLYTEIKEIMGDQLEPNYDLLKDMTYLHMCLEESSRLYPAAFRFDRSCNKDIEINGLKIEKGTTIVIPVYAIHRNPVIWPEPDQFNPERFRPEGKLTRHPMSHMPFGLGPRSCIGMRLALMKMKFAIVHVLLNFRLITCEETQIPVELNKNRMMAEAGLKIKLLKR